MFNDEELKQKFIFLVVPQASLRRMGVRDLTEEFRFKETWHRQPLARNWAATVGSWGCVRMNKDVMELSGTSADAYKKFKQRYAVQAARTESLLVPSARRALTAAIKFSSLDLELEEKIEVVCRDEQILPFELYLYVHGVDSMRKKLHRRKLSDLYEGMYHELFIQEWPDVASAIDMAAARKYDAF